MRKILVPLLVSAAFLGVIAACDSDSTSAPPDAPDAGPKPDVATAQTDTGTTDTGTATDTGTNVDTAAPCPIGIDATITATIKATTDDNYKLYVNGALIDDVARVWSSPQTYSNITLFRNPTRKNVIAIEGIN